MEVFGSFLSFLFFSFFLQSITPYQFNSLKRQRLIYCHSLPGAIGMYCLSLAVQHINEILPQPVYALLSGLNASTVGIIALAAVQLAEKAIKDKLSRILVILGACAGMCYNALWYFPVLMIIGGLATAIWDGWLSQKIGKARATLQRRKQRNSHREADETGAAAENNSLPLEEMRQSPIPPTTSESTARARKQGHPAAVLRQSSVNLAPSNNSEPEVSSDHVIRIRVGIAITILFFGISYPQLF
jgi:hypothetical protein